MWESRVLQRAFERLELHEGKLSRAVLRGGGGGDVTSLPDTWVGNHPGLPGQRPSWSRQRLSWRPTPSRPWPSAGCFMPPETLWKNLPQCRGSWPGFESEPSSLERRISDHLLTGKPRTSRFAWRMANLQEINSTRPTVPAVPRDSSRSCQGWPGWWGFLREQERWAIEPDHAMVGPCHAVRYIPKPTTGSR